MISPFSTVLEFRVHSLEKTVTELRERIAIIERYLETKEEERKSLLECGIKSPVI